MERLDQPKKELQPLEVGDQVLIQNQLGNNPKRWDKRGVVVQTDKEHRQYKVMSHDSSRMTIRNRRFLRKFTKIQTPTGQARHTAHHTVPALTNTNSAQKHH